MQDQGLAGATDARIAEVCAKERHVHLSLDLDFADVRTYPPSESAGIVVFRLARQDAETLRQVVERPLALLPDESPVGRLWVVEEDKLRIRE